MFMMHELGRRQPFVFENFVALRAPPQIKNKLILCSVSLMLLCSRSHSKMWRHAATCL